MQRGVAQIYLRQQRPLQAGEVQVHSLESCRSSAYSTPRSFFAHSLSLRSSVSSVPSDDENIDEDQNTQASDCSYDPIPSTGDINFEAAPNVPDGHIASNPECRYWCTDGFCEVKCQYGRRSEYAKHVESHWSKWYCSECLSTKKEWLLKKIGCHCDMITHPYPDWYHLEIHRIQLEHDKHHSHALELRTVLKEASMTTKYSLKRHLNSKHGGLAANAKDCKVHFKKFATCGMCNEGVLFTSPQTEANHLWNKHWKEDHNMMMWDRDREIQKLIALRSGVYKAWQDIVEGEYPGSSQDPVSWKYLDPPEIKKLLHELGGNSLSDLGTARMVYNKARFPRTVSVSQIYPNPTSSAPSNRDSLQQGPNDLWSTSLLHQDNSHPSDTILPKRPPIIGIRDDMDTNSWEIPGRSTRNGGGDTLMDELRGQQSPDSSPKPTYEAAMTEEAMMPDCDLTDVLSEFIDPRQLDNTHEGGNRRT